MMKFLAKYILAAAVIAGTVMPALAQDNGSSSSSVVRRRGDSGRNSRNGQTAEPGVTTRMQMRLSGESNVSDADRNWMRVIYRDIEVSNPKNASLYFPEDVVEGQENLFRIIMRLLANNQISAYEYLDGKEIFTDQYKLKVRDMLDRFHVLYTDAKGSTEKNPKFAIDESDVPSNEVLSYYIIEKWEFDTRSNKTKRTVEAICPVLHRTDDFGGEAIRYPMFWVKMTDLRPHLAAQYIFIDDDNNLPRYTYADYFNMSMYEGDIYKTRNLMNKSMAQLYPDVEERKQAQDSIQARLEGFDKNIWVPSREEVIAAREAREAAEEAREGADTEAIPSRDGEEAADEDAAASEVKKSTRSRSRSSANKSTSKKKETKKKEAKKPKASKPKSSSSNAVRSVRRRK